MFKKKFIVLLTNKLSLKFRLLTLEGSLLAFSSFGDKDSVVIAMIAANLWDTYKKNGIASLNGDQLQLVLMDCKVRI